MYFFLSYTLLKILSKFCVFYVKIKFYIFKLIYRTNSIKSLFTFKPLDYLRRLKIPVLFTNEFAIIDKIFLYFGIFSQIEKVSEKNPKSEKGWLVHRLSNVSLKILCLFWFCTETMLFWLCTVGHWLARSRDLTYVRKYSTKSKQ